MINSHIIEAPKMIPDPPMPKHATWLAKIRNMPLEELAKFLVCMGEKTDSDEDFSGHTYEYAMPWYYTPFGEYPGWWSEEDVVEETIEQLRKEYESC